MFDISSGTVLYHSWKFARNFEIIFSTNSKYMLGQFGYGHSDEGGGDYSPSTGTCLIEVDTGKEIWCKEEVVSERNALMSQAGGIITGDKGIYDFYTGDRFLTFPQFAKKGDRVFEPQRSGADVVIRALSPDGRYFVATEGKCDPEINKWVLLMYGYCGLAHLTEMETYLGEWDRGVVKQKILRFEENVPSGVRYPFFFLPDGLLVVYSPYEQGVRLMNMKGETVSEIGNQKARGVGYYSLYRHEPEFYFDDKVVTWASAKENEWQVFDFTGKLIGEFAWKDPQGREFKIMGFKMINNREYIFTVDIYLKRNKNGGVIEYMTEVYRGKFGSEDGK